jgi:hypothetical protein
MAPCCWSPTADVHKSEGAGEIRQKEEIDQGLDDQAILDHFYIRARRKDPCGAPGGRIQPVGLGAPRCGDTGQRMGCGRSPAVERQTPGSRGPSGGLGPEDLRRVSTRAERTIILSAGMCRWFHSMRRSDGSCVYVV